MSSAPSGQSAHGSACLTPNTAPPVDYHCHVLENRLCGPDLWVMTLQVVPSLNQPPFQCHPGQFVMVDCPGEGFQFRRPFSILAVHERESFALLYKVVGTGTAKMSRMVAGDELQCLGPLGQGFPTLESPENLLLIGGGIGIAPLAYYSQWLQRQTPDQQSPRCIYGARSHEDFGILRELSQWVDAERLALATDDGSHGFHGNVCQGMHERWSTWVEEAEAAFVCGPNPMMAATVRHLEHVRPDLPVYVSLENPMPCGTGACFGCVVSLKDTELPSRSCINGPVYDAKSLQWTLVGPDVPGEMTICPS